MPVHSCGIKYLEAKLIALILQNIPYGTLIMMGNKVLMILAPIHSEDGLSQQ